MNYEQQHTFRQTSKECNHKFESIVIKPHSSVWYQGGWISRYRAPCLLRKCCFVYWMTSQWIKTVLPCMILKRCNERIRPPRKTIQYIVVSYSVLWYKFGKDIKSGQTKLCVIKKIAFPANFNLIQGKLNKRSVGIVHRGNEDSKEIIDSSDQIKFYTFPWLALRS